LFPKQGVLSNIERIALSFGLSITMVAIIGFALNFTPWGIRLNPILVSIAAIILVCSIIGFVRQQLLPGQLRFSIVLKINGSGWKELSRFQKWMSAASLIVFIAVLGYAVYSAVSLPPGQNPSEFYILNSDGKAENYPVQIKAGEPFSINAVVVNHESQSTDYKIRIIDAGMVISEIDTSSLNRGGKWEETVSIILKASGQNQKIEFYLYKDGEKEPYFKEPLYLYIDVIK